MVIKNEHKKNMNLNTTKDEHSMSSLTHKKKVIKNIIIIIIHVI